MANSNQAIKRARQAEKRRRHNAARRSMMRTLVKKVVKTIEAGDGEAARAAYQGAVPKLDCLARRGLVHKNKAARHKRRLQARIHSM